MLSVPVNASAKGASQGQPFIAKNEVISYIQKEVRSSHYPSSIRFYMKDSLGDSKSLAYKAISMDNALAFNVSHIHTLDFSRKGVTSVYVYFRYNATKKEDLQSDRSAAAIVKSLKLSSLPTQYHKIRRIYDYITNHVRYDYSSYKTLKKNRSYHAYGALLHKKATCQGYAILFQKMCRSAGIPCYIVCGNLKMRNGSGTDNHAWNMVRCDGKWYFADATIDADNLACGNNYGHFLVANSSRYYRFPSSNRDWMDMSSVKILAEHSLAKTDYDLHYVEVQNGSGSGFYSSKKKIAIKAKLPKGAYDVSFRFRSPLGLLHNAKGHKKSTRWIRVSSDTKAYITWKYHHSRINKKMIRIRSITNKKYLCFGSGKGAGTVGFGKKKNPFSTFRLIRKGSRYLIQNRKTGLYLSAFDGKIAQAPKAKAVKWIFVKSSGSSYRIIKGNEAVTVKGNSLVLQQDRNRKSQRFSF